MANILEWILDKRPKLFSQVRRVGGKNYPSGGWKPLSPVADLGTTAAPKSLLSGPDAPVRAQAKPFMDRKIVESFLTRFQTQRKGIRGQKQEVDQQGLYVEW